VIQRALPIEDFDDWRQRASCLAFPQGLFFGCDEAEPPAERRLREEYAKRVCTECSVQGECLTYALAAREQYGIWGGLTESERRARLTGRTR
jgi:WhiB family transcriptional regulator, redox-sensing transcriptional regulator